MRLKSTVRNSPCMRSIVNALSPDNMAAASDPCASGALIHPHCLQSTRISQMTTTEAISVRIVVDGSTVTVPPALAARSEALCALGSDGVIIVDILGGGVALGRRVSCVHRRVRVPRGRR